jgi:hypothetical protein
VRLPFFEIVPLRLTNGWRLAGALMDGQVLVTLRMGLVLVNGKTGILAIQTIGDGFEIAQRIEAGMGC